MIFISYAKEDAPKADRIYSILSRSGRPVFYDKESLLPGMDWRAEIQDKLSACKLLLFLCTPTSVMKEGFVQKELRMALDRAELMPEGRIFIIPIRFDRARVPNSLEGYQWLDIDNEADYDALEFYIDLIWSTLYPEPLFQDKNSTSTSKAILLEPVVLMLQGKNIFGDDVYSYLKLPFFRVPKLKNCMDMGENFKPSDFGTVLAAGRGAAPAELREKMAAEYNLIDLPPPNQAAQEAQAKSRIDDAAETEIQGHFLVGFLETFRAVLGKDAEIPAITPPNSVSNGSTAFREGVKEGLRLAEEIKRSREK